MSECNVRLPEKTTYSNPNGPMTCNLWAKNHLGTNALNISMIFTHPLIPFPFTSQPFVDQNPQATWPEQQKRQSEHPEPRHGSDPFALLLGNERARLLIKTTPKRKRVVLGICFPLFSLGSNSKQRPKEAPSRKKKKTCQDESPEPIGWVQLTPNRFRRARYLGSLRLRLANESIQPERIP